MKLILTILFSTTSFITFGQDDIILSVIEILNIKQESIKEDSISFAYYSSVDSIPQVYSFHWPYSFQYVESVQDFQGNLISSKVYTFDSANQLISEQILNIKSNNFEYIYYLNSKVGNEVTTYVSKSGTKIVQVFDKQHRVKRTTIDVTNDSINYIFGYPPKYTHDYDYDSEIFYKYRRNKLIKSIEYSKTSYPLIVVESITIFKYSRGKLISEQRFEDGEMISNRKFTYDSESRLTGFIVNSFNCKVHYLALSPKIDYVEVYRNNHFVGKLLFTY